MVGVRPPPTQANLLEISWYIPISVGVSTIMGRELYGDRIV